MQREFSVSSQEEGYAALWEPRGEAPGSASGGGGRGGGLCREPLRAGHGGQLGTGLSEQLQGPSQVSDAWLWVTGPGGYGPG